MTALDRAAGDSAGNGPPPGLADGFVVGFDAAYQQFIVADVGQFAGAGIERPKLAFKPHLQRAVEQKSRVAALLS